MTDAPLLGRGRPLPDAPLRIYIDRGPRGGWMHRHERMPDTRHVYIEETRDALEQSPIVHAMIAEAVEREREACAKVAEDDDETRKGWGEHRNMVAAQITEQEIAAAIRRRG